MHWMILPLRRYADFKGRSPRIEYWMFVLFVWLFTGPLLFALAWLGVFPSAKTLHSAPLTPLGWAVSILAWVVVAILFTPLLAVQVRRFHDQDRSGWYVLYGLLPYIGSIVLLIRMCLPGTAGPNRYGEDPREFPYGDPYAGEDRWALAAPSRDHAAATADRLRLPPPRSC